MTPRHSAAAIALLSLAPLAWADAGPVTLAEFPPGTFLENLWVEEDGAILVTSYFAGAIERIGPEGSVATFAALTDHPVSLLPLDDGWLVAAHGAPFTEGPGFLEAQRFLVLDAAGAVVRTIPAPDARFLNGMVGLEDGRALAADSVAGAIWAIDSATGAVEPWLAHEILTQPAGMERFQPGANGLKREGDAILVSNSARGTIHRIPLGPDGAAGEPAIVAAPGAVDDFWVEPGGAIVVATHGATLERIDPDGGRETLLAEGCDGCTAVAPRGPDWIVLTTGGLLEAAGLPARVLALPRAP